LVCHNYRGVILEVYDMEACDMFAPSVNVLLCMRLRYVWYVKQVHGVGLVSVVGVSHVLHVSKRGIG